MIKYFKIPLIVIQCLLLFTSCGNGDCKYSPDAKERAKEWSDDYQIVFEGKGYNSDNNEIYVRKHEGEEITGTYCGFDPQDRLLYQENYLNGKLHGFVFKYQKYQGVIKDTITYENGYKEGREFTSHWSDVLNKLIPLRITNYSKNLKNGPFMEYFDSDEYIQIKSKGNYKYGKADGYWEKYWYNGNIQSKSTFIEGARIKLLKSYDKDGKISSVTEYVLSETGSNKAINEWTWRSKNSEPRSVWCQVKKDGKTKFFYFDEGKSSTNNELVHYDFDGYTDWTVNGYSY